MWHECFVKKDNNGEQELRKDDGNGADNGDPTQNVDCSTPVALQSYLVRPCDYHIHKRSGCTTYQMTTDSWWCQDGCPVILTASCGIDACQLSHCRSTAAQEEEDDEGAINDSHGAALRDSDCECGRDGCGTVADDKTDRDDRNGRHIAKNPLVFTDADLSEGPRFEFLVDLAAAGFCRLVVSMPPVTGKRSEGGQTRVLVLN